MKRIIIGIISITLCFAAIFTFTACSNELTADDFEGEWTGVIKYQHKYRLPDSNKTYYNNYEAVATLSLSSDGTYRISVSGEEAKYIDFPDSWATGTWKVVNNELVLDNRYNSPDVAAGNEKSIGFSFVSGVSSSNSIYSFILHHKQ